MKLERPIVSIDTETTGTDPAVDRIVQIGALKILSLSNDPPTMFCWLINPCVPIPAKSTEVHGITDEMVKSRPTFREVSAQLHEFFYGCDLVGYNHSRFDIPILWEEFYRAGITWNMSGMRVFDAQAIFMKMEERTLSAAVAKYCKREHSGAHDAMMDAAASWDVLKAQLTLYKDVGAMNGDQLHEFCKFDNKIDLAGKLVRNAQGDAEYNFGKNKGKRIADDIGYAHWMLEKDFSTNTKIHLAEEMDKINPRREFSQDLQPF